MIVGYLTYKFIKLTEYQFYKSVMTNERREA